MVLNPDRWNQLLAAIFAMFVSAALFYIGTGLRPIWWAMWLAPIPILLTSLRLRPVGAFLSASVSWVLGSMNMLRYIRSIFALPSGFHWSSVASVLFGIVPFMAVPASVFGMCVLLFRYSSNRGKLWRAALVFPAAWVGFEFLVMSWSPHGTFGNLAYTQMDFLPLLQLASVTGVSGIVFFLFLIPAASVILLERIGTGKQRGLLAASIGISFAVVLAFGIWRMQSTPTGQSVKVGLMASDLPKNIDPQEPGEDTERLINDYANVAATLTAQGAKVVVLPEKLGVTIDPTLSDDNALLHTFANYSKAVVLAGLIRKSGDTRFNEARIYVPAQKTALTYDKQHMLPEFESRLQPGTTRTLINDPSGVWGVTICKDMDFPKLSREYGADGVGLLLVPAWDFNDDGWLHDRMAIMRGVESGFSIARAAKQGLLTISDDRGRVLAQQSSASAPFATLVADVPVRNDKTIYVRFGNLFAWLVTGTLLLIVASLVVRSKNI